MLKHLKYSVTFPTPAPGKTFTQDIHFENGLTAITGANGGGKSLILELSQYALFGSAALRGKADDYEALAVELTVLIKNVEYTIKRGLKEVLLLQGEVPTAKGTKPVNAAITNLLGYGFEVFQVTNVANQGSIEQLGAMKPAERKRLVDETIGLNVLEELSDFIQTEIRDGSTKSKLMEGMLHQPVVPEQPEKYVVSEIAKEAKQVLQDSLTKLQVVKAVAARPLPLPLEEPVDHPQVNDFTKLKLAQAERLKVQQEAVFIEKELAAIPASKSGAVAELDPCDNQLDVYLGVQTERTALSVEIKTLEAMMRPLAIAKHNLVEIEAAEATQLAHARWKQKQQLLKKNVPHDCPKCQHHWEDEDPRVAAEFGDVPEQEPEVTLSKNWREQLEESNRRLTLASKLVELQEKFSSLGDPTDSISRIIAAREAFNTTQVARSNEERRKQLQSRLKDLVVPQDQAQLIQEITERSALVLQWSTNLPTRTEILQAQIDVKTFPADLEGQVSQANERVLEAALYESAVTQYKKAVEKYETEVAALVLVKEELNDWENGKKAVADLRSKVKGCLLPSLNSVASYLLNEMTGGELSWVIVNDQFEVTVEGQRLELLSGAGKAVANLALRLALGQVLTNRVFPVALLDEIDASMDDNRAGYVAKCMKNLTNTIKQVVIISHKPETEADQHIRL